MRKFFSEYPIFATFTTSCLIVVGLFLTFSTLIIFLISKAVTGIAKTENVTKTEDKMGYTYVEGTKTSTNKFLKIPVEGVILAARETTDPLNFLLSSYTYGYEIKNTITIRLAPRCRSAEYAIPVGQPAGPLFSTLLSVILHLMFAGVVILNR